MRCHMSPPPVSLSAKNISTLRRSRYCELLSVLSRILCVELDIENIIIMPHDDNSKLASSVSYLFICKCIFYK